MDALNYAIAHDDGQGADDLESADVVLVGVSRHLEDADLHLSGASRRPSRQCAPGVQGQRPAAAAFGAEASGGGRIDRLAGPG